MARGSGVCRGFARGNCRYGENCKFEHRQSEQAEQSAGSSNAIVRPKLSSEEKAAKQRLRTWTKNCADAEGTLGLVGLRKFFQDAFELVTIDADHMHSVVHALADEGGLRKVKELLKRDFSTLSIAQNQIVSETVVAFLNIVTQPKVADSALLEPDVDRIYNTIWGEEHGDRATTAFEFLSQSVLQLTMKQLEPVLFAFLKVLEKKGKAVVTHRFKQIADAFGSAVKSPNGGDHGDLNSVYVNKLLERIQRRMGVGQAIPDASRSSTVAQSPASFELTLDAPGLLSAAKSRHSNDHEDICRIKILPPSDEIEAERRDYLPPLDPSRLHLPGPAGLIDRQFRLLREDNIGPLRDALRYELLQLQKKTTATKRNRRMCTQSYYNVKFEDLRCLDRKKGLEIIVSFSQPEQVVRKTELSKRKLYWELSKRLKHETLACLIDVTGLSIFCSVQLRRDNTKSTQSFVPTDSENTLAYDLYTDPERAYVTLSLAGSDTQSVRDIAEQFMNRRSRKPVLLVEFPNILLPAFQFTLEALQHMIKSDELPFADMLAPSTVKAGMQDVPPPTYAQQRNFQFDLGGILEQGPKLMLSPNEAFDINALCRQSTLDNAQATAVVEALSRGFAMIQGPPGCGKSYTGVAITRVLLANKQKAALGPIVCVCYTNHALDQILEHLLDSGIKQIIRIGSRSKSERIAPLVLRMVSQQADNTRGERDSVWALQSALKEDVKDLQEVIAGIKNAENPHTLEKFLQERHPEHHAQLMGEDEEGYQRVIYRSKDIFRHWLNAPAGNSLQTRDIGVLTDPQINLWMTTRDERRALHHFWIKEIRKGCRKGIVHALKSFRDNKGKLDQARKERDLRCLQQADIIGVTNSGLARNLDLLRRVRAKVLLCEEAGEVQEAHMLTALLPSVEHVILIGDHLQLRPSCNTYELTYAHERGRQYAFDMSLFERLVQPPPEVPSNELPYSSLEIQRRMHPSISTLIRQTLYPRLKDGGSVSSYPEVAGMRKRLFWFEHNFLEAGLDTNDYVQTSKSNDFEVDFTASLVSHLLAQGIYQSGEIAVLTPYLGQVYKLKTRLSQSFEVVLNEKDEEQLGATDPDDQKLSTSAEHKGIAKTTLLQAVRIATVDNFQGEEAKVVVISLVRCNEIANCGFLKTSNRINVLLSRAMHGRSSASYETVPMWAQVLQILKAQGSFGPKLELCCPRHPDTQIDVTGPEDFMVHSPEGGCNLPCKDRLSCGHKCLQRCHSEMRHNAVKCLEPCIRLKKGCTHACPLPCGDNCHEKCEFLLKNANLVLKCGHIQRDVFCWQNQDPDYVRCAELVMRKVTKCGHEVGVKCYIDVSDENFLCPARCASSLPCGHNCNRRCGTCQRNVARGQGHGDCNQACDRPYTNCSHRCQARCHDGSPCTSCKQKCEVECSHSRCNKLCSEPCTPCAEVSCSSSCPHSKCTLPCAVPCNWTPCSKRCDLMLACEHQCPGLCGEQCPSEEYCQSCAREEIKSTAVDFITGEVYQDVDLSEDPCIFLPCGHFFTMSNLDGVVDFKTAYDLDKTGKVERIKEMAPFATGEMKSLPMCPTCRGSLRSVNRYGRMVRRVLIDEATKRFVTWAGTSYSQLSTRLHHAQEELVDNIDLTGMPRFTGPLTLTGGRQEHYGSIYNATKQWMRYYDMKILRKDLLDFMYQVRDEETPYARIVDLVKLATQRAEGSPGGLRAQETIPQSNFSIMATALVVACDVALTADILEVAQNLRSGPLPTELAVDFTLLRAECEGLVTAAQNIKDQEREVEFHIFFVQYCALEAKYLSTPTASEALKEEGRTHIAMARTLIEQNRKLVSFTEDIEEVERALGSGFVQPLSSEERRAVLSAMAQEFSGTGHWYVCPNNHPFSVGECGRPMEEAVCPQCGETIGGRSHRPAAGVAQASALEDELRQMHMGAGR